MSDLLELLDAALAAAQSGADVLAAASGQVSSVSIKGEEGNFATDVDLAAERAVRAVLAARRPDDLVTGEEFPTAGAANAAVRWSIDPLDGTVNFTRGIPYFATSAGAADSSGRWLVGAVIAPALGKSFFAARGTGAWVASAERVHRLKGAEHREGGARLLGIGYSYSSDVRAEQLRDTANHMASFTDARALGSAAVAICAVAEGVLDGYVESDLAEYDWAAAALIAEEAGLAVERPSALCSTLSVLPRLK